MEIIGAEALNPQVVLEAGDASWDGLEQRIVQLLEDMMPGEVLEMTSMVAGLGEELAAWCTQLGHLLLGSHVSGQKTTYWVRKEEENRR
jgi:TusA-related sulfurtransferase